MQLKFEELTHQQQAIEAVIALFKGELNKTTEFSLNNLGSPDYGKSAGVTP